MSAESLLKKTPYKRMFIAILVGMMLTATSTIASVKASPAITVTVSPSSGTFGTTITVSGDNATADGEVRVYVSVIFVAFFAATTIANSTGGYSVNITVPAVPADTYHLLVLDVETGDTATTTFTVQPKIILAPEEGSCDDEVTVKGYGFRSGQLITITFDGNDVTPMPQPRAGDFGSFEAKFRVPSTPNGTYTITADDGVNSASALFTVIPKITLRPTSGPSSTLVFVSGTGFGSSVAYSIHFDTINITMYTGFAVTTNPDGSFTQVFSVPDVPDGMYLVNATDETGNSATAPFWVPSPIMMLEPNTTFGSSIVTVSGLGFPPKSPVLIYFEDILVVNLLDLMTESEKLFADEYGSYEYSFVVPVTEPGVYTVRAYSLSEDGGLRIGEELASASLTIVENPTLEDIEEEVASITDNLTDITDRLDSIDENVDSIDTTLETIETSVSDVQAKMIPAGYELAVASTILALIAAIGAWISAILIQRKASSTPKAKSK
ncbi:MAG: hypothetical protein ACUVRA_06235 [Candidatus Bathyarchaeaceae archaeon]